MIVMYDEREKCVICILVLILRTIEENKQAKKETTDSVPHPTYLYLISQKKKVL